MSFFSRLFGIRQTQEKEPKKSFDEIYSDLGIFEYSDQGFQVKTNDFEKYLKWSEINQVNAYKRDLVAYDMVVMEIIHGENVLTINEETPGWFQLVIKLKEIFPEIPSDWEIKITQPVFERNFTTIYKKS